MGSCLMRLGKSTPLRQLCLAIDTMVASGSSENDILYEVRNYYARLQRAALEQDIEMKVVASPISKRRRDDT